MERYSSKMKKIILKLRKGEISGLFNKKTGQKVIKNICSGVNPITGQLVAN